VPTRRRDGAPSPSGQAVPRCRRIRPG
jgi:hypothetical protein